jgi:small subunit ribosomal protein S17
MAENVTDQSTAAPPDGDQVRFGGQKPRTQKVGRVVSDKMDKTVVVAVDYVRRHPLYRKRITRTSKYMAHDERNDCKPGDIVRIEETRPLSKHKRWIVREIIERAVQV